LYENVEILIAPPVLGDPTLFSVLKMLFLYKSASLTIQ
jgi:hypothetical protein